MTPTSNDWAVFCQWLSKPLPSGSTISVALPRPDLRPDGVVAFFCHRLLPLRVMVFAALIEPSGFSVSRSPRLSLLGFATPTGTLEGHSE